MPERAPCPCGCANVFPTREAKADLERYRKKGPDPTTRALIDALVAAGVEGTTLLDIGGGIGVIQLELIGAGVVRAHSVDASPAFVRIARAEAKRRGFGDRTTGQVGDFVALAADVPVADVVTLDRVVCCYDDVGALVGQAASHAGRMVGLVYPRVTWWIRAAARLLNLLMPVLRRAAVIYIHPDAAVEGPLRAAGFERRPVKRTLIWQVDLYLRP
jgi:SAM-dependent methyltransferase